MCEVSWQRKSEWRMLSALSRAHTLAAKTNIDMKYKWIRGALGSAVKEECHLKLMLQRWWKNKIESLIFSPFDNQRADTGPLPAVSHHPSRGLKFTGHPCGIHHFSTTFEEMFTPKKWFIAPERKTTTFLWSGGGGVVIFSVLFIYSFISILILALSSHIRAGWFKTWGGSSPSRTCTHTHTHTHTRTVHSPHTREGCSESVCALHWHRALFLFPLPSGATRAFAHNDTNAVSFASSSISVAPAPTPSGSPLHPSSLSIYRLVLNGNFPVLEPGSWKMAPWWKNKIKSNDIKVSQWPVDEGNTMTQQQGILYIDPKSFEQLENTCINLAVSGKWL